MKTITLFIHLLLFNSILCAQIGKVKVVGDTTGSEYAIRLIENSNGQFAMYYLRVDTFGYPQSRPKVWNRYSLIDSNFNIVFDTTFKFVNDLGECAFEDVIKLNNKHYLTGVSSDIFVIGSDNKLFIECYDNSNQGLWRRYFDVPNFDFWGMRILSDSTHLYVTGRGDSSWNPLFIKLDTFGNVVNYQSINAPTMFGKVTKGMIKLNDTLFLLAGDGNIFGSSKDKWSIAITNNGDILYSKLLTTYGAGWVTEVVKGYNDSYYLLGNSINRYSFMGDSISERYYNEVGTAYDMVKSHDSNLVVGGIKFFNPILKADFTITKLDTNGNVIWSHNYDNANQQDFLKKIIATQDGGYVMFGTTSYNGKIDALLIKVDSLGELHYATSYNLFEEHSSHISIYPNPSNGIIQIKSDLDVQKLILYDVTGKLILTRSGNVKMVDISNLASSTYILEVQTKKRIFKQKIVKN